MVKRLPQKEFKYIYSRVPRLCVDLIIQSDEGIILAKRDIPPALGFWHLPGGTILLGENIEQALKRVAQREVHLEIETQELLGVIEYSKEIAPGHSQSIALAYLVKVVGGKLSGSKEAKDVKFFKELPDKIIPEQKLFLSKNVKIFR